MAAKCAFRSKFFIFYFERDVETRKLPLMLVECLLKEQSKVVTSVISLFVALLCANGNLS